jgi:hypothetical protein
VNCPRCGAAQIEGLEECGACGVVFARFRPRPLPPPAEPPESPRWRQGLDWLRSRALDVGPEANPIVLLGRALLFLGLVIWGLRLLSLPMEGEALGGSFMHLLNLVFHEAGHTVFSPFGRFLHVLGGTLGQLLVPLIVVGAFLAKSDPFGASVGTWWLGESLIDCAPYIADARAGQLELLGGVTGSEVPDYHDWQVLLGMLGWMKQDHAIARLAWGAGALLMLGALAWGGYVLWKQAAGWRGSQQG